MGDGIAPLDILTAIFDRLWHRKKRTEMQIGGWIGDAIYGVNDGLGAIFGIIAGVAGYTANAHVVLESGLFGALASTLSMGAGAWLSRKSENELLQTKLFRKQYEIALNPSQQTRQLSLLYQHKGFSVTDAEQLARTMAHNPEIFLKTLAQEELGISDQSTASPWRSGFVGGLSTLIGGIVPLIPFFFLHDAIAMLLAAVVSLIAHFAVGAAKSLVIERRWWSAGLEMTVAGMIVGIAAYTLGLLGSVLMGT